MNVLSGDIQAIQILDDDPWKFLIVTGLQPNTDRGKGANDLEKLADLIKTAAREVITLTYLYTISCINVSLLKEPMGMICVSPPPLQFVLFLQVEVPHVTHLTLKFSIGSGHAEVQKKVADGQYS